MRKRRLTALLLTIGLFPGCVSVPFARRGPSEAHIEGATPSARFLVKGRAPYLIVPRISRISTKRLDMGAIVRAEARDKVYAVNIMNDSRLQLWIRSFHEAGRVVPAVVCLEGVPSALTLPHPVPPGEERMIILRDDRGSREVKLRLRTILDRDDLWIRFDPGPFASLGLLIIPFSRYDYAHLPASCREAARKTPAH